MVRHADDRYAEPQGERAHVVVIANFVNHLRALRTTGVAGSR
jgi:hypothetical protein